MFTDDSNLAEKIADGKDKALTRLEKFNNEVGVAMEIMKYGLALSLPFKQGYTGKDLGKWFESRPELSRRDLADIMGIKRTQTPFDWINEDRQFDKVHAMGVQQLTMEYDLRRFFGDEAADLFADLVSLALAEVDPENYNKVKELVKEKGQKSEDM